MGLRITADVTIHADSVTLDLFGLGAAAGLKQATGTLVIQLLGISNPQVSTLIPFPSKLDETTIENAIVALASIRSKMYDKGTYLSAQVVGFYNNIGGAGSEVTNNVISTILTQNITVKKINIEDGYVGKKIDLPKQSRTSPNTTAPKH